MKTRLLNDANKCQKYAPYFLLGVYAKRKMLISCPVRR